MAEVTTGTSWNVYDANTMSPGEIYGRVMTELARENDKIVGVTADLAKSTNMGIFEKAFPRESYQCRYCRAKYDGCSSRSC